MANTTKAKEIKTEWCEKWIQARFAKHHPFPGGGIEITCFWDMAAAAGLYTPGTYGGAMATAAEKLLTVEPVTSKSGIYLYSIFKLA